MPVEKHNDLSRRQFLMGTAAGLMVQQIPALAGSTAGPSIDQGAASSEPAPLHVPTRKWRAQWIWDQEPAAEKNIYVLFRKPFRLSRQGKSAKALITADSRYKLYVNGHYIGRGPVRYDPAFTFYDEYELAPRLVEGNNVIAAVVHFFGVGNERYILGKEGFLFEMSVETEEQKTLAVASDHTWRAFRATAWNQNSQRENFGNGFTEVLDFRRLPQGWTHPGFNDSEWERAFVIGAPPQLPWKNLVPRMIPPLAEEPARPRLILQVGEVKDMPRPNPLAIADQMEKEQILPVETVSVENPAHLLDGSGSPMTVTTPEEGRSATIVLDFGAEAAAMPFLEVEGVDGAEIDVGFSELLHDNKPAVVRPASGPMYTADRLILRSGPVRWERFFFSGIRFLQLTFRKCRQPVKVRYVGINKINYAYVDQGYFRCSDPLLNRIWEFGQYTTKCCTHDVFVDCPWREKAQWVEMATPLVSYVCFGSRPVAEQYLRTLALSQDKDGRFWIPYPSAYYTELPDQTMWWGMHLWLYYLHFGDETTLRDLYPNLIKANEWFEKHLEPPGLLSTAHWYTPINFQKKAEHPFVWIDWGLTDTYKKLPKSEQFAQGAALNCTYYHFLLNAAKIARLLGYGNSALDFESKAVQVKQAINKIYWSEDDGFYYEDVEHKQRGDQASILAVVYEIAPKQQWARICKTLMSENYEVGTSSPYFYIFIFDALEKAGLYDLALAAMRARFGKMLSEGATTAWEGWNLGLEEDKAVTGWSFCHAYSAGSTYSLSSAVLGVRPTERGFSSFTVRPQSETLQWAEGTVPTPQGPISVAWAKDDPHRAFKLSASVPAQTQGLVSIPVLAGAQGVLRLGTSIFFQEGRQVQKIKGIEKVQKLEDTIEVTVASGTYFFYLE